MSYLIVVLIWYTISCAEIKAYRDEELFLQARQHYEAGECAKALDCYKAMKQKGRATYYNMGNCYYHIDDPVEAMACWSGAQKGASYQEYDALTHAISTLEQQYLPDQYKPRQWGRIIGRFFDRTFSPFSLLAMQLLFLISWCSLCIFVYWRRRGKLFFLILIMLAIMVLLLGGGLLSKYNRYVWNKRAIISMDNALLLSGPHTQYHVICALPLIDELVVRERIPGWARVESCRVAKSGWIEDNKIRVIDSD